MILVIDFRNRDCKARMHQKCCGRWQGFGFDIICCCACHSKNETALESVYSPASNVNSLSQSPSLTGEQR